MFKRLIIFLINVLEFITIKKNSEKIIDCVQLENYKVKTNNGYKNIKYVFITKPLKHYKVTTVSGKSLICADTHRVLFFNKEKKCEEYIFVKDLCKGDFIFTTNGWEEVSDYIDLKYEMSMFDIEVDSEEHSYFSSDILSHNTTTAALFVAWYMIFNFEKHAIFVSKTYSDAKEVLKKTNAILQNLPFYMKPGIVNMNESKMVFDNGCSITAISTTRASGVGHTLNVLYMDEFAHIPTGFVDDFYENGIPTLSQDPNSKLIITSTPKGYNKFYKIWRDATTDINEKGLGINGFKGIKVDYWEVPGRDEEWKRAEILRLGSEKAFNEQHGNQFLTSSKLLLENETLKLFKDSEVVYVQRDFDILKEYKLEHPIYFHPDFDMDNIDSGETYFVFSIDVGEGTGEDYSAITGYYVELMNEEEIKNLANYKNIYDIFKLNQFMKFTHNRLDPKEFAKFCYILFMEIFNHENIKIVLEWNALGQSLYNSMYLVFPDINDLYDELFVKYKHKSTDIVKKVGIRHSSQETKNFWALNFRDAALKSRIIINEKETVEQLSFFGRTDKGSYKGQTGNDDLAMTSLNSASIIDTPEWYEFIESLVDTYPDALKEEIENIIEKKLDSSDDSEDLADLFDNQFTETYFDRN